MTADYQRRPMDGHILLVPKKQIRSLSNLRPDEDVFLAEVFRTAQTLVKELDLAVSGYRLIVNGGAYQDVPLLHFHLVSSEHAAP